MKNAVVLFFVWVLVTAGAIYLEFRLAKTASKWPGLVLPIVTFLYSLLVLFAFASPDSIGPQGSVGPVASIVGASVSFFFAFLIANIPTFVFLAIYFAVREKKKRDEQMEKMHIKDL